MTEQFLYWVGFLTYAVAVIWIGWRKDVRATDSPADAQQFWAAGKSLNAWSVGLSISASFMSISWSCVYAVQLFYWYGVSALWLAAIPWLLVMLGFFILAPRFRRFQAFTQPELVAGRFGDKTRAFVALPVAFVFLVWGGAEIYAAASVLQPLLEAPFHLVLFLIALVVALYSYMGGFAAVVVTDRVQFILVAFFIIAIAWIAGTSVLAEQDFASALTGLPAPPKTAGSALSLWAISPGLILMTFVAYLPGWLVETDIWLRVQAARDLRAARGGIAIASVNSALFVAVFPMLIGLSALLLFPPKGAEIPPALKDGAAIFSVLMAQHAPLWLSVLLAVGLAAAAMSTIDTCSNVMAVSLSYDIIEPRLSGRRNTKQLRRVSQIMSAAAVFFAYIYALFTESLWDIFYLSSGILTTTVVLPVAAVFLPGTRSSQVRAAAIAGFAGTLFFYFLESHGPLRTLEPDWLGETQLGYIVYGLLCSGTAFLLAHGKGGGR